MPDTEPDTEEDASGECAIRVRQRIQFEADRLLQAKGVESYFPSSSKCAAGVIVPERCGSHTRERRLPGRGGRNHPSN
jgi:hypothetical protein